MSMQPKGPGQRPGFATLSLDYPMSLGVFDKYEDAQKAVDTLSDKGFPVENVLIVGTELKQLERVTGRLSWGRVALGGILSGLWLGLFVGLIFALFADPDSSATALLLSTALYGALFGLVWSLIGYAFTRGSRDFQSVSQVVATKYEVFAEHKVASQGREILAEAGLRPGYGYSQPSVTPFEPAVPSVSTPPVPPAPSAPPPAGPPASSAPPPDDRPPA
jgi:hypothetical protein